MKSQTITVSVLALFTIALSTTSCKKSQVLSSHIESVQSQSAFMNATNDVINVDSIANEDFDLLINDDEASVLQGSKCYTVTFSPSRNVYPRTKTIDFGTGCTNAAGVTKKGKIIVTQYGPKREARGRFSEITYDNYYVNNIHVEGSIQVNKVANGTKIVYKHIVHKTFTTDDGDIKDWNSNLNWTLVQGGDTKSEADDVYNITGHAEGKETLDGIEANNWRADVDKKNVLVKSPSCKRITQGGVIIKIHIKNGDDLNEYLDYGDGSCDNLGTLSINGGEPQVVTLPLRFWPLN